MSCEPCGDRPKNPNRGFTKAVVEINNPEEVPVLFRRVDIASSLGDEDDVPVTIGKYKNVLLVYEANGHAYLYSSDGIPTQITTSTEELEKLIAQETADREEADELIQDELDEKQDVLTAGDNITIEEDSGTGNLIISASGEGAYYTAGEGLTLDGTEFSADTSVLATVAYVDTAVAAAETEEISSTDWSNLWQ